MKLLSKEELVRIDGGSLSGTLLSSIIRGIGVVVDIGRSIGTAIRRIKENKLCNM